MPELHIAYTNSRKAVLRRGGGAYCRRFTMHMNACAKVGREKGPRQGLQWHEGARQRGGGPLWVHHKQKHARANCRVKGPLRLVAVKQRTLAQTEERKLSALRIVTVLWHAGAKAHESTHDLPSVQRRRRLWWPPCCPAEATAADSRAA